MQFILICIIFIPFVNLQEHQNLTEEERALIECCFQNLDCCTQRPTNFEVRALLLKCHNAEYDSEKFKNMKTVRKIRCSPNESNLVVNKCKKKIKLTIKIKNVGLTNCKNQYILIDHVFDSITGQKQKLFNPYVIKINQQPIMEKYDLCFDSMVNAQAKEFVYNKDTTPEYKGCSPDSSTNSVCGVVQYGNEPIPYSSGFCCPCNTRNNNINDANQSENYKFSLYAIPNVAENAIEDNQYYKNTNFYLNETKRSNIHKRGGQDCNDKYTPPNVDPEEYHASSHCLKFSDLWYTVYRIKKPKIQHTLSLQIFQKYQTLDNGCKWRELSKKFSILIGTDARLFANEDQSITVSYTAIDISEGNFGLNYKVHRILIPDIANVENINVHPEARGGPDEYLVIKSNQIQSNGKSCNIAGVGYEAFAKQPNKCGMPKGSCLKNQPIHMWEEDSSKQLKGIKGNYFLKYFGLLPANPVTSNSDNITLSLLFTKLHTSILELELKDDENTILRPNSLATITEVYTDGSDPQKSSIVAKVFNTGLVASVFYVSLIDCPLSLPASFSHITSMPALIPPQLQHIFKLDIQCPLTKSSFFCSLQVLNMKHELIAIRKIRFEKYDRCVCIYYCFCTCYEADDGLKCTEVLSLLAYHAAGFQGSTPVALQIVEYSVMDYLVSMMIYIVLTLCLTLLLMGLVKALVGLCIVSVGLWGLDVVLDLPRKINHYYEKSIRYRKVKYGDSGWPIHPVTGERTRNIPIQAEFCINVIFFVIYPFCVIWTFIKHYTSKQVDCKNVNVCYCKQGTAVARKNSGLQNSVNKNPEKYKTLHCSCK